MTDGGAPASVCGCFELNQTRTPADRKTVALVGVGICVLEPYFLSTVQPRMIRTTAVLVVVGNPTFVQVLLLSYHASAMQSAEGDTAVLEKR